MTSPALRGAFDGLLDSEAKGFFYLKFALNDYTTDDGLDAIVRRAHDLYDQAVAQERITSFTPSFVFFAHEQRITMRIQKAETSAEEPYVIAEVPLLPAFDPSCKHCVVVLA